MLLSIIIPVYNCGPVITRCLESIDFHEAEVIVVDDGSQDISSLTVQEYAKTHPNVKFIRKENGGVSSARNKGIEEAKGDYIMFIDADDYIAQGGIGRIVKLAEDNNADIVKYKVVSVNPDVAQSVNIDTIPIKTEIIFGVGKAMERYDISDYHVVDAIFKRRIIMENRIRFHEDLKLREDDVFMGEFYCHASVVVITDLPLYQYVRCSPYSSTHNLNIEKQRQLIESSYRAMEYRSGYVKKFHLESLPLERLKYMRWVCHPQGAINAGYSYDEYRRILQIYKGYGCWPLDYRWIHVAGLDYSIKETAKRRIKTFLCNHPRLAYVFLKKH